MGQIFLKSNHVAFGDQRLNKRYAHLLSSMISSKSNVIYRLSEDHASMMANYRFMDNEKVSIADLIGKVVSPTVATSADRDVLIISDTTEFSMDARDGFRGVKR